MTAQPLHIDRHGTTTNYAHGCRCEPCRIAHRQYSNKYFRRESLATDCSVVKGEGKGLTSRCQEIATTLTQADAELRRIARLANRSEKAYAKYREQLEDAKAERARCRSERDGHATECDAAAARWAA